MGNLWASSLSWYAFARCHGNSKLRCYFLLFLLSFPQFGACKTKFIKLKCRSSDVYWSVLQTVSKCNMFLWESNAFGEILVIMAVIAVISFQFPKMDFLMFYNIQTLCDTV